MATDPELLPNLELTDALPNARFGELHHRTIAAPIDEVWPACLHVTTREVRVVGPLFAVRGLPKKLRGGRPPELAEDQSLLAAFQHEGFVLLRSDPEPVDGRALVLFGAAGKFWSVTGNAPRRFDVPQDLLDFAEPDFAVTVARLEAIDQGDGTTRVETETLISGTDAASTAKFAPYWAFIRLPSGLIRRSWLAAIDRRVTE